MTVNLHTQRVTVPTAFVTKGRQRVKQYGTTLYLRNGDEFEIELFNPTNNKILAKIKLNGTSIGSGIVLRPGERVFLERYLDESKKFLFETYEIDGTDPNAKEAIKLNGIVEVEFFNEYKPMSYYNNPIVYTYYSNPSWTYTPGVYYCNTLGTWNSTGSAKGVSAQQSEMTYTCSCNNLNNPVLNENNSVQGFTPIETGRVEKGSDSNQSFSYDSTTFNTYHSWKTTWTILPESQKVFAKEDLSIYCSNCGSKRKKSNHKFCPNCGQKFS
jgi:hypothetical protein